MNNSGLEKLFTKCKSLGYPNSKEEFEKDFQQFVASELDYSQLESISGGSVKNKICASALSALSVLGATSSTGAVNSTKVDNYAGKSSGRSWLSKHKEAVITGAVSVVSTLGLTSLITSPFIYKQATQSIKYNTIKNRIKKLVPWYFTKFYLRGHVSYSRSDLIKSINGINGSNSDQVNEKLEEFFVSKVPEDLKNLYEDINAKIRKFDDQVKKLICIGHFSNYTWGIPFCLCYGKYDDLNRMIRTCSDKDILSYINGKKGDIDDIIYFCPEVLCEKPKMVVPSNEEGTGAELIDFSTEFLDPNYNGEHREKLQWLISIMRNDDSNTQKKNFLKAVGEVLGVELDNNSEPQTTNEHDTNGIELAGQQ